MFEEKKIVNNKNDLFVESESELHYIKCSPDSDEYLKIWIKQPTWLQVEKAMNTVLKLDAKTQSMDLDLNAMYRYMVDNFIDRKHGREAVSYPDETWQHDSLKETLEPTYGIILYQEQVMQIAQILAGYTLGGADMLRRAMGKKKPEEMAKQRSIFK